jgi:hypothetical protein
VRPLLGGTLHVGVRVEPALALGAAERDLLERLDPDDIQLDAEGGRTYIGPLRGLARGEVESALRQQQSRRPSLALTAAYRAPDAEELTRVLDKMTRQGMIEQRPIEGVEDAKRLSRGAALVGGDTLVVVTHEGVTSDRLLRARLEAAGGGPTAPALDGAFVAARAAPTALGAWLDREELSHALQTPPGRALRSADARLRLEQDRRARARTSTSTASRPTSCRCRSPGRSRCRPARRSPARRRTRA